MPSKTVTAIILSYWAIYAVLAKLVEPVGWFSSPSLLERSGVVGHVTLLLLPAVLLLIFYYAKRRRQRTDGVRGVSAGLGRELAFQEIRGRARYQLRITGCGMQILSKWPKQSLMNHAKILPVELLMIDPEWLESNRDFADTLGSFMGIDKYTETVRSSFDELKALCTAWNDTSTNTYKFSLRVYKSMPTCSMVMIDWNHETAEAVCEFFLYRSGERRPRIHAVSTTSEDSFFSLLRDRNQALWNSARLIV